MFEAAPFPIALWNTVLELLKALAALLLSLVSVASMGPHLAVVLIALGEAGVAYLVLPRAPENLTEEGRAIYRAERRRVFRRRRKRLAIWAATVFTGLVFSNGFGIPGVDYAISLAVAAALVWQTLSTAQKADKIFGHLLETVGALIPRHRVPVEVGPSAEPPARVGDGTSPHEP